MESTFKFLSLVEATTINAVAKNIFDCMGHYARWDVVSLNLRERGWSPTSTLLAPQQVDFGRLETVARKYGMDKGVLEALIADLSQSAAK